MGYGLERLGNGEGFEELQFAKPVDNSAFLRVKLAVFAVIWSPQMLFRQAVYTSFGAFDE